MTTLQICILIIQANPPGTDPLGGDIEQRNLDAALSTALARDLFAPPLLLAAARIADLPRALRRHQPHILHFIGHGNGEGGLLLNASDDCSGALLAAADLADLVRVYQAEATTPLQLIVLAGCQTAGAAALLSAHVTCAIGTTGDIDDAAVRDHLSPTFYAALADGRTVDNALADAQAQLRSHGHVNDAAMLELFKRGDIAPDGLRPMAWLTAPVPVTVLSPLHLAYLRHWFGQPWRHLSLADLNSDRADKADLLDLYVPLPVDFALTVRMEEGKIVDWWVSGKMAFGNSATAESRTSRKLGTTRDWTDLGVGEAFLQPVINNIQYNLKIQNTTSASMCSDEHEQPPFEAHHAASLRTHFVLLGNPGSGKSSFLRYLTLCLAGTLRHKVNDLNVPATANLAALYPEWDGELLANYTPLYLEMRDIVRAVFPQPTEPIHLINPQILWRYLDAHPDLAEYTDLLRSLINDGKLILLLDGLDEISQADELGRREQVIAFVTMLKEQYPMLRIIISSRPYTYHSEEWRLTGFGHTELAPLKLDKLEQLAQKLFKVARMTETEREAKKFADALRYHTYVEPTLYANPLFFTLLVALWFDGNQPQLPTTQADLYRRSIDLLLDKWTLRRSSGLSVSERLRIEPEALRLVLEQLACSIHDQRKPWEDTTLFRTSRLLDEIEDANLYLNAQDVAEYLERHAGLLISPHRGHFYFIHRTFQEHLAACALTCIDPERTLSIAVDRRFPGGLISRVLERPQLWYNVALLASDKLIRQGQDDKVWALLDDLCRPYMEKDHHAAAVPVALAIAQRHGLFALDRFDRGNRAIKYAYDELINVAHRVLTDDAHFTPEERNIAGELLGCRPEHDTRPGVGCANGLPAIDWVKIPESNEQGRREFVYQENEIRTEPTFWIARYPVTYGQFQAFLDANDGFYNPLWWEGLAVPEGEKAKPGDQAFKFWNHPRERVSWYDTIAFCRWLTVKAKSTQALLPSELQGRIDWRITLPTEWQWEKAARGFAGRRYPWGMEYISGYANIDETWQNGGFHYLQKTSSVGMYGQNISPFGIADMSGNVWEYCLNEYSNPDCTQETSDATRVARGGSWSSNWNLASLLFRDHWNLRFGDFLGFRVVVVGFSVPV